ncbi:MAG: uroporphyrinogen-III synthase [Pseudomonadota bacterium]
MSSAPPRLLVTRPIEQGQRQCEDLRGLGFEAEVVPLIHIKPAVDVHSVQSAWSTLTGWDWVFFVSPNAVRQFFAARPVEAPRAWPPQVKVGALGPGTSLALEEAGVPAEQVTAPPPRLPQVDSEALWQQLASQVWTQRRVLIVRGDGGRAWLAGQLVAHGAQVKFLQAYVRAVPAWTALQRHTVQAALDHPKRHLWLFSSSQSIDHLEHLCPQGEPIWPCAQALASHPRIGERAHAAGFGRVLSAPPDLEGLAACIQSAAW